MMNKYIYSTFDEVQLEKEIHGSFAELKAYLDNYVRRLNEENIQNNESHRFHCNNFADAEYICEMCNIQLKAKLVKEPLFTVEDPDWEGEDGDLLYIEAEELIGFANDEVLFTNHPNIRFYKLEDAITFLRKYHFNVILHDDYITNDLEEWLEIFEDKSDTYNKDKINEYQNYLQKFKTIHIIDDEHEDIEFLDASPLTYKDMKHFIKVYETEYPSQMHNLNKYLDMYQIFEKMNDVKELRDSSIIMDYISYIRQLLLSDLNNLVFEIERNNVENHIRYFEQINEELGFDNKGAMIEEDEYNYYVEILGKNHCYKQLDFNKVSIQNNQSRLRCYILEQYLNAVENINVDNEFKFIYDYLDANETLKNKPSLLVKEIEDDKQYMIRQVLEAQKKILK